MHLRLALNLQHFLLDLGALYALHLAPNFYEIHPRYFAWYLGYACTFVTDFAVMEGFSGN
jgi:hypothetical protein